MYGIQNWYFNTNIDINTKANIIWIKLKLEKRL